MYDKRIRKPETTKLVGGQTISAGYPWSINFPVSVNSLRCTK